MITIYTELAITAPLLLLIAVLAFKIFSADNPVVLFFAITLDSAAVIIALFVLVHKILTLIL